MKTITAAELIELLQDYAPDTKVIFSTDYGDHSHTQQALGLRGESEEVTITKSAYSNSGFAIAEPDEDDVDEMGEQNADMYLVIR
jgi:hypothetical protein